MPGASRYTLKQPHALIAVVVLGHDHGLRAGRPGDKAGGFGGAGEGGGRCAAVSRDDEDVAVGVAAVPVEGDVAAVRGEVGGGDFGEAQELLQELIRHGGDSTIWKGKSARMEEEQKV